VERRGVDALRANERLEIEIPITLPIKERDARTCSSESMDEIKQYESADGAVVGQQDRMFLAALASNTSLRKR
jgi:hypothetical protein